MTAKAKSMLIYFTGPRTIGEARSFHASIAAAGPSHGLRVARVARLRFRPLRLM